ncbi:helix-turn-helix domain-containing protein [Nocardioides dongxiaopingii]|uniref:helix-turn-helix domain-containing protein n=1 Tax=Nocardioides sp. S-1144 TaxID=2582905 RepID=UPI0016522889|nr:helix-turn-helix transcriptional regulator [Nocardioides sp. S-1144]
MTVDETRSLNELTEREREIVARLVHGQTNDQVAERSFISSFTVETHVNRAMRKLQVSDRAQAGLGRRDAGRAPQVLRDQVGVSQATGVLTGRHNIDRETARSVDRTSSSTGWGQRA